MVCWCVQVADELVKELAECEKKDHTSGNELVSVYSHYHPCSYNTMDSLYI